MTHDPLGRTTPMTHDPLGRTIPYNPQSFRLRDPLQYAGRAPVDQQPRHLSWRRA